jgi:hypothetical protein
VTSLSPVGASAFVVAGNKRRVMKALSWRNVNGELPAVTHVLLESGLLGHAE